MSRTVIGEADICEVIQGEREQAWSLQDLAWWTHELGIPCKELIQWLNAMSRSYMERTD